MLAAPGPPAALHTNRLAEASARLMLTTAQLRCPLFDRLTGRLAPALPHPTAKAFDRKVWREVIKDDLLGQRDEDLAKAAIYVGGALEAIRRDLLEDLFDGLSGDQLVELAVANANRGWNVFRWQLDQALPKPDGEMRYIPALGREGIPVGPDGALMSVDDVNNAVIDALPYWFAEVAQAADQPKELDFEATRELIHRGHFVTNPMQVFRSIWQEVLWEPWRFDFDNSTAVLAPRQPDDLARWRAWDWREQTLVGQSSLLSRNLEKDIDDLELAIPLTAVAIGSDGIEVGAPGNQTASEHRSALENLQKSYVGAFLEEALGDDERLTVPLLEKAVCVLQDLVMLRLPRGVDPATLDDSDPRQFACAFPREHLSGLLQSTLGIDDSLASACLDQLTANPFANLGELFTAGLWHRPLVRSKDGGTIMLVAGALVWGSPLRRVERWLQKGSGGDLSKTPAGIRYEAALRAALAEAIAENPILAGTVTAVSSIPAGQAGEEIDLLLRIGSTIIVGEVKCLVGPAEPIDRHNYVRKLEGACAQAARKTQWLFDHPAELVARLGAEAETCRLQPLVVVNQSNGVEWEYDGCPITDARFLELFLGDGDYVFGGKLYNEPGRPPDLYLRTLYRSAEEAEAAIPGIFRRIPGMDPFRDSIRWGENIMPLPAGRSLRLAVPEQDAEAYIARMKELLGEPE